MIQKMETISRETLWTALLPLRGHVITLRKMVIESGQSHPEFQKVNLTFRDEAVHAYNEIARALGVEEMEV